VDEEVLKLISLATEIFINDLTTRAVYFTEYEKRKIMKVNIFIIKRLKISKRSLTKIINICFLKMK
jgi:hypothetical protein